MAKVTGPLYSMTASGKIADAMVFFGWKGIAVVRQWLIPLNRESAGQGDVRMVLGGVGRAAGKVAVDSGYDTLLRAAVNLPSDQTKQSYLVKRIRELFFTGLGSTFRTSYKTILAECTGHTAYTTFGTHAVEAGIADFDLSYAAVAPFEKALGLYVLAKGAISLGFAGSPYTKTLAKWVSTHISKLVAHLG
jgi:hypothetical protein